LNGEKVGCKAKKMPRLPVEELKRIEKTYRLIRIFDILIALIVFVLCGTFLWPFILIIFIIVKLSSPGPFIYSQIRLGWCGNSFIIYKIRTMPTNAEKLGPQVSGPHDTRCTSFGRWLRKTRIDEIPQFWNVLRGEMSIVGPRPERAERFFELSNQIEGYYDRILVPQGITGEAQVSIEYGHNSEVEIRKHAYDALFFNNYSLVRYLTILFKTPLVMFGLKGM